MKKSTIDQLRFAAKEEFPYATDIEIEKLIQNDSNVIIASHIGYVLSAFFGFKLGLYLAERFIK